MNDLLERDDDDFDDERDLASSELDDDSQPASAFDRIAALDVARVRRVAVIAGVERELAGGEYEETQEIDVELTKSERMRAADQMFGLLDEIREKEDELRQQMKVLRGQISEVRGRAAGLNKQATTGVETRSVRVVIVRDEQAFELVTIRCDTGAEIARRPMSFMERQLELGLQRPGDAPAPLLTVATEAAQVAKALEVDTHALAPGGGPLAPKARRRRASSREEAFDAGS